MKKKSVSISEAVLVVLAGCIIGFFAAALILSIQVAIFGGLAMIFCNWVLPIFQVDFPLTWSQGVAVGTGVLIIRWMAGAGCGVKIKKS